jgi:putative FmdB family regulatory protein
MPLYDRECKACQRVFEVLESAEGYTPCSCGGETKRLIPSSVGFTGFALDWQVQRDMQDPKARNMIAKNKAWLESPEMKAKRDSGQVQVKESGPSWTRPEYERKAY